MYKVENQYGEVIGNESSIKKAYSVVEQYYQSSVSIDLPAARKEIAQMETAYLPCCMDKSIVCTIREA